ncbi:hypothetical protein N0V93_009642 [Gnomoniopsis smithogilvyi]|uniref:Exosome complex protein n=1 Tax=Gnomoniopsis smithogilvyi TaxID=1191159 RepID=A0A9W9CTZ8_9PEZI|nr:hypothetical protein N0V93_009642 [Gnomoniopsis smithogilvyi]
MDVTDITAQLSQLDGDIDNMEETMNPLIANLPEIAAQLPLLDKVKLYVLAVYTIETTLFNALRLQGIDAKTHPIFTELTRVKQYFAKIKTAEEPPAPRANTLDTQAAIRFIKADLADNQDVNTKLKEQLAKERAKAAFKAAREAKGKKRPADDVEDVAPETSKDEAADDDSDSSDEEGEVEMPEKNKGSGRVSKGGKPKNTKRGARSKKQKKDKS